MIAEIQDTNVSLKLYVYLYRTQNRFILLKAYCTTSRTTQSLKHSEREREKHIQKDGHLTFSLIP